MTSEIGMEKVETSSCCCSKLSRLFSERKNKNNIVSYFRVKRIPSRFHAGPLVVYSKWVCIYNQFNCRRLNSYCKDDWFSFLKKKQRATKRRKVLIDFVISTLFFFFKRILRTAMCYEKTKKSCCWLLPGALSGYKRCRLNSSGWERDGRH
jgi:hypothetical protein